MIYLKGLIGIAVLVAVGALAVALIRFNRKRLLVIRAAAAATDQQLEDVYRLVEACGTEAPSGFVLARTNDMRPDSASIVHLPSGLEDFPWGSRSIAVEAEREVRLRVVDAAAQPTRLLGRRYRPVAVPRYAGKSGKVRNRFIPSQYVKGNAELRAQLQSICPLYPEELLSYLLYAGRASFEFEPIDQARIGATPAWVQDPEFQYCDSCQKRMALILQIPGTLVHENAYNGATFYLFGCRQHADRTATVAQFT